MKHSPLLFSAVALSLALAGCNALQTQQAAAKPAATASSAPATRTPSAPAAPASGAPAAPETEAAPQAEQRQGAPVRIFLAQKEQAQGMTALKLKDTTLWYAPQPILTRADLARATPLQTQDGRSAILLNFTPEGAKELANATGAGNKGRYLVVVVGNDLVAAPQIDTQLNDGALGFVVTNAAQSQNIMDALQGSARK